MKYNDNIVDIATRNNKPIHIKPSYNTYLRDIWEGKNVIKFAAYIRNFITSCEFIDNINFTINVRAYNDEELNTLVNELGDMVKNQISAHLFNSYGRLAGNTEVPELQITDIYDFWKIYSSDGICFEKNLKARADREKELIIPIRRKTSE